MACIVVSVFILAFLYSMFGTKHKSKDVCVFECGVKRIQQIGKNTDLYNIELFPIVAFLIFDVMFIFLLAFVSENKFTLCSFSNLLTIMFFPIIGFIFVLAKNANKSG